MLIEKSVIEEYPILEIKKSEQAYEIIKAIIGNDINKQEYFIVITLDNASKPITAKVVFKGTVNNTLVHPRDVYRIAIEDNASGVIVAHNHPSGSLQPSTMDNKVTKRLREAGSLVGIELLDHLIVTERDYFSYLESGDLFL